MTRIVLICLAIALAVSSQAQFQITEPDKSPLDISYYPFAYPILKFQGKNPPARPSARVVYSRPQKNGREIFGGDLVKYNEIWRLGANECTEIEFFRDVTIDKKKVAKGRYSMYCIPTPERWTLILNKDLDSWGAFSYKQANDVLRVSVPVAQMEEPVEYFTMVFDTNGNLVIAWDKLRANLPIAYAAK